MSIVFSGWLEKRKRKALQGFAKRFFWLDSKGVLSYAYNEKSPVRDSIYIGLANISRSKRRREIHIDDGGSSVWHCKALNDKDFETWTSAFTSYINVKDVKKKGGGNSSHSHDFERKRMIRKAANIAQIFDIINKMASPIQELEHIYAYLQTLEPNGSPSQSTLGKIIDTAKQNAHLSSTSPKFPLSEDQYKSLGTAIETLRVHQLRLVSIARNATESVSSSPVIASPDPSSVPFTISASPKSSPDEVSILSKESGDTYFFDAADESFDLQRRATEVDLDALDEGPTSSEPESGESVDSDSEGSFTSIETQHTPISKGTTQWRKQLPQPVAGEEVSLFGLMRNNIGKDLSKITLPVQINEPLSALQRMAEAYESCHLLDQAASATDIVDKLVYLATFGISAYGTTKFRTMRKPFNPMMNETFEIIRPDKSNLKFISEKVVHQPPTMASFASGGSNGATWQIQSTSTGKSKFWGRSMELSEEGRTIITLKNKEGKMEFSIVRPSTFVRNITMGDKFLEHVGEMKIECLSSDAYAIVDFQEGSKWGGHTSRNKVHGKIYDDRGSQAAEISGRWDDSVSRHLGSHTNKELWRCPEFPQDAPKFYGFSSFGVTLNELHADIREQIAPTDSRFNPAQRAMENGDINAAGKYKDALEENQRERRKAGLIGAPVWFEKDGDDEWIYKGGYFETRKTGAWKKTEIFDLD